jgi:23S rRNA pseudouridine1911/1915/1917 synthase
VRGFTHFVATAEPFIAGESGRFLAVFKPAGMHSTPIARDGSVAAAKAPQSSLLTWLLAQRPEYAAAFADPDLDRRAAAECGMLSRLDRETSGLILFAKTPETLEEALSLQAARRIKKSYRLIAAPAFSSGGLPGSRPALSRDPRIERFFSPARGSTIDALAIECYFRPYGEGRATVACLDPDAAGAFRKERSSERYSTTFRRLDEPVLEALAERPDCLVLEAEIFSGFRHQIRAHLAWTGHPILGDERYGGAMAPRLFLEACRIEIEAGSAGAPDAGTPEECFELYGKPPRLASASAASMNT